MHFLKTKTLVSLAAISALLLGGFVFAGPANAATQSTSPHGASVEVGRFTSSPATGAAQPATLTPQELKDVNAVLAASNTITHRFDATTAARAGASATVVADAAAVLSNSGWTVAGAVKADTSVASHVVIAAAARCAGKNGFNGYYYPWGYQFGANSCNTSKIIAAVGLGAAGAGVVTAALVLIGVTAVAAPVAGLVAAIIGFGAAALVTCQVFSSNGATWINLGGTPVASCWGQ